jgi:hypothetical protein
MDRIYFLMFGAALILGGVFGLVETAIRFSAGRAQAGRNSQDIESPSLVPTEEDLEMVVVRERETNPDGTPRQEIIRELHVGDSVALEPEAPPEDGRDEIRVVVADRGTIGYVPSAKVSRVLDLLSEGAQLHTEVSHIAEADGQRGVWINLSVWR